MSQSKTTRVLSLSSRSRVSSMPTLSIRILTAEQNGLLPDDDTTTCVMLRPLSHIVGTGDRRAAEVLKRICDFPRNLDYITNESDLLDSNCHLSKGGRAHGHYVMCTVSSFEGNEFGKIITFVRTSFFAHCPVLIISTVCSARMKHLAQRSYSDSNSAPRISFLQ